MIIFFPLPLPLLCCLSFSFFWVLPIFGWEFGKKLIFLPEDFEDEKYISSHNEEKNITQQIFYEKTFMYLMNFSPLIDRWHFSLYPLLKCLRNVPKKTERNKHVWKLKATQKIIITYIATCNFMIEISIIWKVCHDLLSNFSVYKKEFFRNISFLLFIFLISSYESSQIPKTCREIYYLKG